MSRERPCPLRLSGGRACTCVELRCGSFDAMRCAAPRRAAPAPRRSDIACCHVDATLTPIRTMAIASRMALAEFLIIFSCIGKGERL